MGARPGTGLGQPRWLQTSLKDPPVGKKNQVWQRARLVSSSDLQRPAPQGPVPLPPTELEARRRLRPRAHGVRSGFALPAPGRWRLLLRLTSLFARQSGWHWRSDPQTHQEAPGGRVLGLQRPRHGTARAGAGRLPWGFVSPRLLVCGPGPWPLRPAVPSHGGHSRLRPRAACVGRLRSASTRQHVWGHCPPGSPRVRRGSDSVVRGASQATHTSLGTATRHSGTARGGAERAAERPAVPCGLGGALPARGLGCPICTQGRRLPRGRGVSGTPGRPP